MKKKKKHKHNFGTTTLRITRKSYRRFIKYKDTPTETWNDFINFLLDYWIAGEKAKQEKEVVTNG